MRLAEAERQQYAGIANPQRKHSILFHELFLFCVRVDHRAQSKPLRRTQTAHRNMMHAAIFVLAFRLASRHHKTDVLIAPHYAVIIPEKVCPVTQKILKEPA